MKKQILERMFRVQNSIDMGEICLSAARAQIGTYEEVRTPQNKCFLTAAEENLQKATAYGKDATLLYSRLKTLQTQPA